VITNLLVTKFYARDGASAHTRTSLTQEVVPASFILRLWKVQLPECPLPEPQTLAYWSYPGAPEPLHFQPCTMDERVGIREST
jgi:hypothetical protein